MWRLGLKSNAGRSRQLAVCFYLHPVFIKIQWRSNCRCKTNKYFFRLWVCVGPNKIISLLDSFVRKRRLCPFFTPDDEPFFLPDAWWSIDCNGCVYMHQTTVRRLFHVYPLLTVRYPVKKTDVYLRSKGLIIKVFTPEIDCDQTAMGLPPITSAVLLTAK
jgi:hypothetical protein